jgi:hypothetical protein
MHHGDEKARLPHKHWQAHHRAYLTPSNLSPRMGSEPHKHTKKCCANYAQSDSALTQEGRITALKVALHFPQTARANASVKVTVVNARTRCFPIVAFAASVTSEAR